MLEPRTRIETAKLRWLIADGRTLITELASWCLDEPPTGRWETIQLAAVNGRVPVKEIIAAIRAGKIRLYRVPGDESYHGFKVCRDDFAAVPSLAGRTADDPRPYG